MKYQAGNRVTGVINNITDLGIFVTLPNRHSGLVHHSDFGNNWEREKRHYKIGDDVRVVVLHVHHGRFSLSIARLNDPKLIDHNNQFSGTPANQFSDVEFYKKIKSVTSQDELDKIEDELIDRFGDYPEAVENLLAVAGLKVDADYAQALTVLKTGDKIKVEFNNAASHELEGPNIFKALEHVNMKARISMNQEKRMVVLLQMPDEMKNRVLFNELTTFLQAASDIIQR